MAASAIAGACGKKGPPLAPLPRIPAAVSDWTAVRRHETVLLTFVVPALNVSGDQPGDVAAIEVYAVTSPTPPELAEGPVPLSLSLVSTTRVRRPVPPLPAGDAAKVPPVPREPGVADQGERITVTERLTAAVRRAAAAPAPVAGAEQTGDPPRLALPMVFVPEASGLKRHYVVAAVNRAGRRSAWSAVQSVPVGTGPAAPPVPALTYDASAMSLSWTPPPGARTGASAPPEGLLESRPLGPAEAATRYNVYPADAGDVSGDESGEPTPALNESAAVQASFVVTGVVFDEERCFAVRAIDTLDGVDVEGPSSAPACVTPRDTFPPAAPAALDAVGGVGVISLIWDRVEASDLAGYLVLRGDAGTDPTTLLTPDPIVASSFEDRTVAPGARYVYIVVAIDSATPANRSEPSNRAEGAAR